MSTWVINSLPLPLVMSGIQVINHKGPNVHVNSSINNSLDNRLLNSGLSRIGNQEHHGTRSPWHTQSCLLLYSRKISCKLGRPLECLKNCQLGIDLTFHVPSIKGHPVMTSS